MLTGQCLCGSVKLELSTMPIQKIHCYCSMCQKAHGSDHSEWAIALKSEVQFIAKPELISEYESSPGVVRRFCACCGSNLQWHDQSDFCINHVAFALALLDQPYLDIDVTEYFKESRSE